MSVPAGWYDDGSGRQRWWDGEQWTEHYAPESSPAAAPSESTAGDDVTPDAGASGEPHSEYIPPVAPGATEATQPTEAYPAVTPDGYPQSGFGDAPAHGQDAYGQNAYGQGGYGQQGYLGAGGGDAQNAYAAPAPYGAAAGYGGAYPAADAGPRKTPVLGYVGLGLAVIGGIIACVPGLITFGIGSFLLFGAFVVSIIALFIKNTAKWPGIAGLVLSIVMGVVATIVLSVTLFTTLADNSWESSDDPYATDEPYASDEPYDEETTAPDAGGERPSAQELATGLETIVDESGAGGFPDDLLLCLGDAFYASEMSDEALQMVAAGSTDFTDPADGLDFASTFAEAAGTCSQ